MGTVVAFASTAGVAIAGDTSGTTEETETADATVSSGRVQRVFDFGQAGAGAAGPPGGIQEFGRRLESEYRTQEREHDRLGIERLGRIAGRLAERTGVDAVVVTRDEAGVARLREIREDGSALAAETVALGSGGPVALGRLEGADPDRTLDETVVLVREAVDVASRRDGITDDSIDVWSLATDRGSVS